VLNLDAEYELQAKTHTPSAKTVARLPDLVRALGGLIGPDDVVLGAADRLARGVYAGRAWCPTPRACERLERAGATPVPAAAMAVLRRVNHRRFAAELGQMLPGARYITRMEELLDVIAGESPTEQWLIKRPFGFAGRGRRRVATGTLDPSAAPWIEASLRDGEGLQVEPWMERAGDYALHGYVSWRGELVLGDPTQQRCDDSGAWKETSLMTDLRREERDALVTSAERAGHALAEAGYFGPFGVDAFRWRDRSDMSFNARSEINARYSMGWAIGMGPRRPDLE
jgi:hypothetical protein